MQTGHLTAYAIDEMPPGRQKVQTFVLPDTASHIDKVNSVVAYSTSIGLIVTKFSTRLHSSVLLFI